MIKQHIQDNNIDFYFSPRLFSLLNALHPLTNSLTPADYSFLHVPRPSGLGGEALPQSSSPNIHY